MNDEFDMIAAMGEAAVAKVQRDKCDEATVVKAKYTPFDFIKAASFGKKNLIADDEQPDVIEKSYVPFIVNKGFANFEDSILHANEMNIHHQLPKSAQFYYYLGALRPRNRFSKWHKLSKDVDLDLIQKYYQCNRQVAKQYLKVLPPEELKHINTIVAEGGAK